MPRPLRFLSLFSGIGGLDLGLERAGMQCVAQVEIDPFCRRVLAKHWPDVPRFEDVRTVTKDMLPNGIDLIAGGFPCQDISNAGKRAGIDGERSGLWSEYFRLICEIRPGFIVVENVAALLIRGLGRVLGDLAACGYDAEWDCLPAFSVGAPHERDRVFIVAYPSGDGQAEQGWSRSNQGRPHRAREWRELFNFAGNDGSKELLAGRPYRGPWSTKSSLHRVAYGVPRRVDRIFGLGNAVVPQVAEWIGRRIIEAPVPA